MEYNNICMGCMGDKGQIDLCPHCGYIEGTPPPNAQYLLPRTMLAGKYLLGRGLGHGGFGITYLAYDTVLKRKLAIKEFLPQDCATRSAGQIEISPFSGEEKRDQFFYGVDKFLEEARTLAQFDGHPNIVGVRDFFKENGTAYLVMNYLSGETLKDYLRRHERALGYQQALKIMLPVMDALRTVHAAGVLHRDVSPDNIFLTNGGQVKLIDFGAARQPVNGQRSISVILKPGYAPEEQYRSRGKQGPWTDVYATAATFYRAITGKVPPESLDRMEQDTLIPPSQLGVRIPAEAEAILLKAMAVRATDRYQTMQQCKDALAATSGKEGTTQRPVSTTIPMQNDSWHVQTAAQNNPAPYQASQPAQTPVQNRSMPARQQPMQYHNDQPTTYLLKHKQTKGIKVGILIASLIVLVVVGGVLLVLYGIGSVLDRPDEQTSQTQNEQNTPSQVATASPTGNAVIHTPIPSADTSVVPETTPLPANMQIGAAPSKMVSSYTPTSGQIISIKDGANTRRMLTGSLGTGIVCEMNLDENQDPIGTTYVYFADDSGNIRYASLGEETNGALYLPVNCSVGTIWNSLGKTFEVIAVDYTATLGGAQVKGCIVVKSGTTYRFYVPGVGLHTIRTSLELEEGIAYTITENKGTNLDLAELISVG